MLSIYLIVQLLICTCFLDGSDRTLSDPCELMGAFEQTQIPDWPVRQRVDCDCRPQHAIVVGRDIFGLPTSAAFSLQQKGGLSRNKHTKTRLFENVEINKHSTLGNTFFEKRAHRYVRARR